MKLDTKKFSFYTAILTSVLALVTFIVAVMTTPISGPICKLGCISYPYSNVASQFPKDYFWMFLAIIFVLLYVILFVCIEQLAADNRKLFGKIATAFAIMSATIIASCYFVQLAVIQPSLINGETAGIALLTQYNPHGVFVALEEIGYIFMSISFLFAGLVFAGKRKLENAIRRVFILGFVFTLVALAVIATLLGLHREYIFEVAAITITWSTLTINGALIALFLKQPVRKTLKG